MSHFFKFVLLVVAGISLVAAAERPPCKGVPDGKFVKDPTGCEKYFSCKDEKETPGNCREGYYFDLRTGGCNYQANVYCVDAKHVDQICVGVADGTFLKDPENCQNYYVCEKQKPIKGSCEKGLQFYPDSQMCGEVDKTKCDITDPSKLTAEEIACRYVPNTVFVQDESDCQKYYVCVNGKGKSLSCDTGFLYNKKRGICDYSENIECSVVVKPDDKEICGVGASHPYAFVKNPKKCDGYYVCVDDKIHSSGNCPKDYLFDSEKKMCSKTAKCTLDETKLCQGEKDAKMFVQPSTNCKSYYFCKDEKTEKKDCPPSTLFNEEISQCVYDDVYDCPIKSDTSPAPPTPTPAPPSPTPAPPSPTPAPPSPTPAPPSPTPAPPSPTPAPPSPTPAPPSPTPAPPSPTPAPPSPTPAPPSPTPAPPSPTPAPPSPSPAPPSTEDGATAET